MEVFLAKDRIRQEKIRKEEEKRKRLKEKEMEERKTCHICYKKGKQCDRCTRTYECKNCNIQWHYTFKPNDHEYRDPEDQDWYRDYGPTDYCTKCNIDAITSLSTIIGTDDPKYNC